MTIGLKEEERKVVVLNRRGRRIKAFQKRTKLEKERGYPKPSRKMEPGIQDSSKTMFREYLIPYAHKSRSGVEYTHYKKVVDVIGLDEKK